jgi:hypothetical protein
MMKNISTKTRAILVGVFLLVAYGVLVSSITQSQILVMLADVISGLAVIGIAVLMYPLFKETNKQLSKLYLVLKYTEGASMIIGGVLFLFATLQYTRGIIYEGFHVYVFIISAFIFYYLFFKSKLVPRFISVWGALGIFALLLSTTLQLLNISYPVIDYFLVLIIANEVFLAIWLMVKGFNESVSGKNQL